MCECVCVLNLPLARNLLQLAGSKSKEAGEELAKRTKLEVQLKTLATLRIRLVIGTR